MSGSMLSSGDSVANRMEERHSPAQNTPELDDGVQLCVLSTDGSGGSAAMGIDGRPLHPAWAVWGVIQWERVAFLGGETA